MTSHSVDPSAFGFNLNVLSLRYRVTVANYGEIMGDDDISPAQCRAARAYLGWGRREFAKLAGVHEDTVLNFEVGRTLRHKRVRTSPETRAKIRKAVEAAGLAFAGSDLILPYAIVRG